MLPYCSPGLRSWNYISTAQSPYHVWFESLGFPQLDITKYEDGEWCIIEYQHSPIIPAECHYKVVLAGLRNIEISFSFIERYLDEINPMSARFWANLDKHENLQNAEYETFEKNAEDRAERASRFVLQNPDLMERIAKHGLVEMDIFKIRKNIPNYKF
jgi:hypothetical protein